MAKEKREVREKHKGSFGGLLIPAGLFIGMGIGFLTNFVAGLFIGLGVGFLGFLLCEFLKKK